NVNFAIRSSVLQTFLQSHGIASSTSAEIGTEYSTADLADRVAAAVVPILCFAVPATTEIPRSNGGSQTVGAGGEDQDVPERIAVGFTLAYHDAWSLPNDEALAFMRTVYTRPLNFYRKEIAAGAVLEEKRRFADRWP